MYVHPREMLTQVQRGILLNVFIVVVFAVVGVRFSQVSMCREQISTCDRYIIWMPCNY